MRKVHPSELVLWEGSERHVDARRRREAYLG
jgi:hypothetical protein